MKRRRLHTKARFQGNTQNFLRPPSRRGAKRALLRCMNEIDVSLSEALEILKVLDLDPLSKRVIGKMLMQASLSVGVIKEVLGVVK
jgi:hypothetical protein